MKQGPRTLAGGGNLPVIMGDAKVAGIVATVWTTAEITRMRRDVNVRTLRFFVLRLYT